MANEEFPWIVEAEIYDSDSPSAQIVVQTEASLEDDGYVRFENMSISEITSSFKIRYKFKIPQGLTDSNYTPPSLASTKSLSSTKAEFSCISDQSNMVVVENEFFDLSVSVIDKFSSKQVKNLDWKNHTWQATIGIHKMEKCQAEGSLQVDSLNTSAYLADGVFNFENLYINKTGMYVLTVSLKTSDDDYSFTCLSKSIIVSKVKTVLDDTTIPSSYFTFEGDFNEYKDKVEDIKAVMYNCYLEKYGLTLKTPISVYRGSVMVNFDYLGNAENMTKFGQDVAAGIEIVPGLSLVSAILNDRQIEIEKAEIETPVTETIQEISAAIKIRENILALLILTFFQFYFIYF